MSHFFLEMSDLLFFVWYLCILKLGVVVLCCTLTLRSKHKGGAPKACAKASANTKTKGNPKKALAQTKAKAKKALAKAKAKAMSKSKALAQKKLKAAAKQKATKTKSKTVKGKTVKSKTKRTLKTSYHNVYSRIYHRERKGGCSLEEAGVSPVHSLLTTWLSIPSQGYLPIFFHVLGAGSQACPRSCYRWFDS